MYLLKKLIRLSSNNCFKFKYDKRMESIDSIGTYAYKRSKYIVSKKEEIKCENIVKQYKTV